MRIFVSLLFAVHGLIHLSGFLRAFNFIDQSAKAITKTNGIIWLVGAVLFLFTAVLFFVGLSYWWIISAIAIVVSQYAISTSWQEAKTGTLVNIVVLAITIIYFVLYRSSQMHPDMQV